jgi:hypothetical protein
MKSLRDLRKAVREHEPPSAEAFLAARQIHEVIRNAPAMRDAILYCPEARAAALLEGLQNFRETSPVADYATSSLVYATRGDGRLTKILTVLHLAGFNIGEMSSLSFESRRIHSFADHLDMTRKSAHQRMEAFRIEPDPVKVVARPWWQDFYGKNTSRFPGDITLWQRFLQPMIDPRFGPKAIFLLALFGGALGAIFFRLAFSF